MKKLVPILLLATVTPFCAQGEQTGGTLAGTLAGQGLAGAKLERRYGNHLMVPVSINNRHGALMIVAFGESVADVGIGAEGSPVDAALALSATLGLALTAAL